MLESYEVAVLYKNQQATLPFIIVKWDGPIRLDHNIIVLDWKEIHLIHSASLHAILERHKVVFEEKLGKAFEAKILVEPEAMPKFCKARSVPLAMCEKVEERLTQEGILKPVEFSSWSAPTVIVLKADESSVRLCGDFHLTVNHVAKLDRYLIPKVDDLFAKSAGAGGQLFMV